MTIYKKWWKPTVIIEYLREIWKIININEILWNSLKFNEINENQHESLKVEENWWKSLKRNENLWKINENPWKIIEFVDVVLAFQSFLSRGGEKKKEDRLEGFALYTLYIYIYHYK